ncbi:hypothetical protein N656DRAFT_784559 [Canariomyces notabilis]|uniref:Uncharacterized protein n=1 Tax=Canariomyces notabilis TaxID=2074819 RepID=A0AAN6QIG6_9PEZI|nr:hypothetical protein N656DRAFT_784559 [Canariomyces arenarius]
MEDQLGDEYSATSRSSCHSSPVGRSQRPGSASLGLFLGWFGLVGDPQAEAAQNGASVEVLQREVRELRSRVRNARNEAKEAWNKVGAEQDVNRKLRQTIEELESERDSLGRSVKELEAQIRQVQALAFEGIGDDSWAAGDDSTARVDLENLHGRLKAWAKKYAIDEMSEVQGLAPDQFQSFIQLLAQVVRNRFDAPNVIENFQSGPMNRKSPAICIQGLLSHHVYVNIVGQPFFVLGETGKALQNVYRAIYRVNGNESHAWRSRTLRLLATPPADMQQGDKPHDYSAFQKAICHQVAEEFFSGPAKHLIQSSHRESKDSDGQCFKDLDSIVQYAGDLSYRLWTRRTVVRVVSLPDLCNMPFRGNSDLMKAHPLHRLYEDEDRCDGWLIGVVAHPAVLADGTSDGKDYNTARVWMKVEVLLAEE